MKKLLFTLMSLCALTTQAAQIMVDTDEFSNNNNGNCSLTEAVLSAGFNLAFDQCVSGSGDDQIVFDINLFNNILNTMTVDFTSTLPVFNESLDITVPNGKVLWIRGNSQDPMLSVSLNSNETFTMNNTQFTGGSSTEPGGAIVFEGEERFINLDHVWFINNQSDVAGGAIGFNRDPNITSVVTVNISDSLFNGNNTDGSGGAIHAPENYTLDISDSDFIGNNAVDSGGAISSSGFMTVTGSVFDGNMASSGGAIRSNESRLEVRNSVITNNQAVVTGGGIYKIANFTETAESLVLERTSVINNFSERTAGVQAIYVNVYATNNLIANNASTLGVGGLHVFLLNANDGDHDVHIIGNTFYKNLSNGVDASAAGDMDVYFSANNSSYVGNAVISESQSANVALCDFRRTAQINSAHNLSNVSNGCLVGNNNQLLVEPNAVLEPFSGFHPFEVVPQPGSPLIDTWLKADCLDDLGSDLELDLTGERGLFGVTFDGDDDGVRDCDIGSTEAYEGIMVTVLTTGAGTGSVVSMPAGIDCNPDCNLAFPLGSQLTLTASADPNSQFIGWSGAGCSGTSDCIFTVPDVSNLTVQAEFQPAQTYELSVVKSGDGTGLVESDLSGISCGNSCVASFIENSSITLTATADPDNGFIAWSGNCVVNGNECTVTLTEDTVIGAEFMALIHPLQVAVSGQGSGLVTSTPSGISCPTDCDQDYSTGTVVTLSYTPDPGTTFVGWSGDCSGTGDCVLTMDQAHQVTAEIDILHQLDVTVNGPGSVTSIPVGIDCPVACDQDFSSGTFIRLQASANPNANFVGWSGACTGLGDCTFNINQDTAVTALFESDVFELSINNSSGGTVTSADGGINCGSDCSSDYPFNTLVQLTAQADPGFDFIGWSGGGTCVDSSLTCEVSVTQDTVINAVFAIESFQLSINNSSGGTVTSADGGINCGSDCVSDYPFNTLVQLTAQADPGFVFNGWSGGGTCVDSALTCEVTVTQDTVINATFVADIFELSISNSSGGTVTSADGGIDCGSDCSSDYPFNTLVQLTAQADPGFVFTGWSGGGTCVDSALTCEVTVTQDTVINAVFAAETFVLSINNSSGGTVTSADGGIDCGLDCVADYPINTLVQLTAQADPGFVFIGWSGGGTCIDSSLTCEVNVVQNTVINAVFESDVIFADDFDN